jgi:hypothetical protein
LLVKLVFSKLILINVSAKKIKGNLLEFIVRQLLFNCGFRSTVPDGHYVYAQTGSGLFFVNGKGAAHDADVLMNPPIQLPFSYPTRLLFECKAYHRTVGLGVIRGALGLRYDINEFEIVTEDSINERKNNRRSTYAISARNRYNYQVGVASVRNFSSSAFEYAANNKIPLISLSWFLDATACNLFDDIIPTYVTAIDDEILEDLNSFLRSRELNPPKSLVLQNFLRNDQVIGQILNRSSIWITSSLIGLNEFGDLFFLFPNENFNRESFSGLGDRELLNARIHYWSDEPGTWYLNFEGMPRHQEYGLKFYLPDKYMEVWAESNLNNSEALNIKQRFFSRIYLFGSNFSEDTIPFRIIEIDQSWLDQLRRG